MATLLDLNTPSHIENFMSSRQEHILTNSKVVRDALSNHLEIFIYDESLPANEGGARVVNIEPGASLKFEGDFIGLLRHVGSPPEHDWINLRINNLNNSTDFNGDKTVIYLVNENIYQQVLNQVTTQLRR